MHRIRFLPTRAALATLGLLGTTAAPAAFLHNGGLEDLGGTWADTTCGYMAIAPGSTAVQGWTVSTAASGPMVWGRGPTCDGFSAAAGRHFVDLSGFGTAAGLGAALEQSLSALVAGESYTVSLQYFGNAPDIRIDGSSLGAVGTGLMAWSTLSASFVAGSSMAPLSLRNVPSSGFVFIDEVRVSGPEAGGPGSVPLPSSAALAALGLALAAGGRRLAR